jgi:hypothetical protein
VRSCCTPPGIALVPHPASHEMPQRARSVGVEPHHVRCQPWNTVRRNCLTTCVVPFGSSTIRFARRTCPAPLPASIILAWAALALLCSHRVWCRESWFRLGAIVTPCVRTGTAAGDGAGRGTPRHARSSRVEPGPSGRSEADGADHRALGAAGTRLVLGADDLGAPTADGRARPSGAVPRAATPLCSHRGADLGSWWDRAR